MAFNGIQPLRRRDYDWTDVIRIDKPSTWILNIVIKTEAKCRWMYPNKTRLLGAVRDQMKPRLLPYGAKARPAWRRRCGREPQSSWRRWTARGREKRAQSRKAACRIERMRWRNREDGPHHQDFGGQMFVESRLLSVVLWRTTTGSLWAILSFGQWATCSPFSLTEIS